MTTGVLAFLAGLAFSGHCALMCGAFPVALQGGARDTGPRRPGRRIVLPALYLAGKTWAYVLLGAAAGIAGARLQSLRVPLGIAAGGLLLLAGTARLLPGWRSFGSLPPGLRRLVLAAPLCDAIGGLLRSPGPRAALVVGIFNGFVPCGAVYAMLLHAAALGSAREAGLSMLWFGLGTAPALLLIGVAAGAARARLAASPAAGRLARAAAWAPIVLGVLTLWRTFGGMQSHLHSPIARAFTP